MRDEDQFKAPMLEFDTTREFNEICQKPILPNWIIQQAIETIKFKMDEAGVKLKSEAGMMVGRGAFVAKDLPRFFYFNDRYAVFIAEKGKKPYFAMLVEDAAKLQKPEFVVSREDEASARAVFRQGLDAFNVENYQEARELWQRAEKLDPTSSDVQMALRKVDEILSK